MSYQLSNSQAGKRQLISDGHATAEAAVDAGNTWLKDHEFTIVDQWADIGGFRVCVYRGLNCPGLGRLIIESVRAKDA